MKLRNSQLTAVDKVVEYALEKAFSLCSPLSQRDQSRNREKLNTSQTDVVTHINADIDIFNDASRKVAAPVDKQTEKSESTLIKLRQMTCPFCKA